MITLEKCKQILNQEYEKFNNEEIKLLREYLYLYLLAELQIESEEEHKK